MKAASSSASAAGSGSAAGGALAGDLAGVLATRQLGQTQLQQAAKLAQQQGVVVGGKVARIRAGEGQHAEIAEPHQGHRVDQHVVTEQRLLLALVEPARSSP